METQANQMPVYDFSEGGFGDFLETVQAADEKSTRKFMAPGEHAVRITEVEYKGTAKNDDGWDAFNLVLTNAENQSIKYYVMVMKPNIGRSWYGPEKSPFPAQKLKQLLVAFGSSDIKSDADLTGALKKYLSNPVKLIGRELTIDVGYNKPHLKYSGKRDDGKAVYTIVTGTGELHEKFNGEVFGLQEAKAVAEANDVTLQAFAGVLKVTRKGAGKSSASF